MPPPNLLFLFTDEQRYDTMAAYGNAKIQTPDLNRLAEKLMRLLAFPDRRPFPCHAGGRRVP